MISYFISVIDRVTVAGCYTSYRKKMEDAMKEQLAEMREIKKEIKKKEDKHEDLIDTHKDLFNEIVHDNNYLQRHVNNLQTSLDESELSLNEMSEMFGEFLSRKGVLDEKIKRNKQRQVSRNGNADNQVEMTQAQASSLNAVQVITQDNERPQEENEMPPIDI